MDEYELTILDCPPLATDEVVKHTLDWIRAPGAFGQIVGAFRTEVGQLGQIIILRNFEDTEQATLERKRTLEAPAPFGGSRIVKSYRQRSYRRLPFLPPVEAQRNGSIYEIRVYELRPGGLAATIAAWEPAVRAASSYTERLVTCLHAIDGSPQLAHIWQFDSFEQRTSLRAAHYAAGTWPPRGGPEQILRAWSTIAFGVPELMCRS